jgi:cell division protein ZapA
MKDRADDSQDATPVTIFGRTYHLRGNEDPAYLVELAQIVDRKMRETADATGTADTLKLAILTCLNVADDYLQTRRGGPPRPDEGVERRLVRMRTLLDEALAG